MNGRRKSGAFCVSLESDEVGSADSAVFSVGGLDESEESSGDLDEGSEVVMKIFANGDRGKIGLLKSFGFL